MKRPRQRARTDKKGQAAEAWAAARLAAQGYRILAHNLRTPAGELDLLALQGGVLVAVEVKARQPLAWARGYEALRPHQLARIARAIEWCADRRGWRGDLRIDLAAVTLDGEVPCGLTVYTGVDRELRSPD